MQSGVTLLRAGFPYEVLANAHYVPGFERFEAARYRGKELWKGVMTVSPEAALLYCQRVVDSFNAQVSADATIKAKAGCCDSRVELLAESSPAGHRAAPGFDGSHLAVLLAAPQAGGQFTRGDDAAHLRDVHVRVRWQQTKAKPVTFLHMNKSPANPVTLWPGWLGLRS